MKNELKKVTVKILRSASSVDKDSHFVSYEVPLDGKSTVLNALYYIADNIDPSLGYYGSCRIGKCAAACAIMVNGKNLRSCATLLEGDVELKPLTAFRVIKDLVVDDFHKNA